MMNTLLDKEPEPKEENLYEPISGSSSFLDFPKESLNSFIQLNLI